MSGEQSCHRRTLEQLQSRWCSMPEISFREVACKRGADFQRLAFIIKLHPRVIDELCLTSETINTSHGSHIVIHASSQYRTDGLAQKCRVEQRLTSIVDNIYIAIASAYSLVFTALTLPLFDRCILKGGPTRFVPSKAHRRQ